jgi:threonine synthase
MLDAPSRPADRPTHCNPQLDAFVCLRCGTEHPVDDYDAGCPRCLHDGFPANLHARYRGKAGTLAPAVALPYPGCVSLGEGCTPLVEAPELAAALGIDRVSLKLEWCNPTGSHKDRMSAQLVARARDRGFRHVVAASSGNAGASIAAYAARAGLSAEIVTTPALPHPYRWAIDAHGARITLAADSLARWHEVGSRVAEGAFAATNYRLPAVGTNPFGIEGYKTLAAEIAGSDTRPDLIVVPTARGDLLSGLHLGFAELGGPLPQLVAAEPFPRLARVMAGEDYRGTFPGETAQFSIAGSTVTYQAVHALRQTHGSAIPVGDDDAIDAGRHLARAGFHAELSAAATLAAARTLAGDGALRACHVLLVLTGAGFRDQESHRQDLHRAIGPTLRENR